jgi:hypothetical protein
MACTFHHIYLIMIVHMLVPTITCAQGAHGLVAELLNRVAPNSMNYRRVAHHINHVTEHTLNACRDSRRTLNHVYSP